jgi:hypothetical protein
VTLARAVGTRFLLARRPLATAGVMIVVAAAVLQAAVAPGGQTATVDGGTCTARWKIATRVPGASLSGVAVAASNDVWVVGKRMLAMRWNGRTWRRVVVNGPAFPIAGIYAHSPTSVWLAGVLA